MENNDVDQETRPRVLPRIEESLALAGRIGPDEFINSPDNWLIPISIFILI